MEGIWLGENEKSYFKFDDLEPNRQITFPLYPKQLYDKLKKLKPVDKVKDEYRIVSVDVSVMKGKANDNSVFSVLRLIPKRNRNGNMYYERQIVHMEIMQGGHSTLQAIKIRQIYDDYDCDYIVVDCQGVGMSVYDALCQDLYDKERGIMYDAFTSMNDKEMADRCLVDDAPKKIYSMKAYTQINSECAISFRDNLRKGKIKLLLNENEAKEVFGKMSGFNSLSLDDQLRYLSPYLQTTSLISEMINLESEINTETGQVKLKEQSGQRKDRWSSVSYGNYFANILEKNLQSEKKEQDWSNVPMFVSNLNWNNV